MEWILKLIFFNGVIKNMVEMEELLESFDFDFLNYIIVRFCGLGLGKFVIL